MIEPPPPAPGCGSCAARDVVIEELRAANAQLVERVTALERIVGRNSGNSSMPPSSDDLPGRKKAAAETGARVGVQSGQAARRGGQLAAVGGQP